MSARQKVSVVFGTRPEAIKLAPLVLALRADPTFETQVLFSGQHPDLVRPILDFFGVEVDSALDIMSPGQSLAALTARAMTALDGAFRALRPDWVVVQGDTTTAMTAALAAFYQKTPVAHLEAGLRTHAIYAPFPEEINRRCIGQLAALHWAPTPSAAEALRAERLPVPPARLAVTGNTGIDAVRLGVELLRRRPLEDADVHAVVAHRATDPRARCVLVTTHRRENVGAPLQRLCESIRGAADAHPHSLFVLPVHPNPEVAETVRQILGGHPRVRLTVPKEYPAFLRLLELADGILTDSGGVQEEAPSLGKRVLVTRECTERPEGIGTGHVRLVGCDPEAIRRGLDEILEGTSSHLAPAFPYGDGHAAERCVASLAGRPFAEFVPA